MPEEESAADGGHGCEHAELAFGDDYPSDADRCGTTPAHEYAFVVDVDVKAQMVLCETHLRFWNEQPVPEEVRVK